MKLDELEKLANEADPDSDWYDVTDNYGDLVVLQQEDQRFIGAVDPQTVKRLISLVRLQNRAIIGTGIRWPICMEALSAYEAFEKEET